MTEPFFHLRTTENPPKYVHQLRGAYYVSWVTEKDKAHAAVFPADKIADWRRVVSDLAGCDLVSELPGTHMLKVEMKFSDPEQEEQPTVECAGCGRSVFSHSATNWRRIQNRDTKSFEFHCPACCWPA